jgi:hypothetical protein
MKIESSKTLVGKGRHTHLARNKKSGFITRIMLAGMEWAGHTKKDHAASAGQRNLRDEKPDNNGHGLICAIGRRRESLQQFSILLCKSCVLQTSKKI